MKNTVRYILILIILVIIFIILNFCKLKKDIFDDIMILGLWSGDGIKNEYEINSQDSVHIDVFSTINTRYNKKIAPGSKGSFIIKFKRPENSNYKINVTEKTSKPQNLVFSIENQKYLSLEEVEKAINEKFINTEKITINWEWKYYIDEIHDIQDTKDGKENQKYIFEIEAIIEEGERTEI